MYNTKLSFADEDINKGRGRVEDSQNSLNGVSQLTAVVPQSQPTQAPSLLSGDKYGRYTICCRVQRLIICKQTQTNAPLRLRQKNYNDYGMAYTPNLRIQPMF